MTEATHTEVADGARAGDATRLVPVGLAERIRAYYPAGAAWLDELPRLIATCARRWDLTLLPAFEPGGDSSWTAPVRLGDGELGVLQITVPMPVTSDRVTALKAWAGRGAVRLFAHDEAIRATLMECCVPGTHAEHLSPAAADDVAATVLPQLWAADLSGLVEPDRLESLDTAAAKRARLMDERAEQFGNVVDTGTYREVARLFGALPASSDRSVLLHGDFHRRNVVLSQRGWLAIDPHGLVGDPSYDAALFLQHDMDGAVTSARADALADRLGLDRERTRRWLFALGVQAASWHLSIGDRATHDAITDTALNLWTA
ncbi:aminoglycoside phosphotransferase family protein [Actinopolymorpha sp. NPDC004070]|uniref:aminoglycoside phosphotransferase family protein n=1 Tax=Actinopolymorpha sp. NPDC004070 TaxID=3154548 RepID=UPI0033AEB0D1